MVADAYVVVAASWAAVAYSVVASSCLASWVVVGTWFVGMDIGDNILLVDVVDFSHRRVRVVLGWDWPQVVLPYASSAVAFGPFVH